MENERTGMSRTSPRGHMETITAVGNFGYLWGGVRDAVQDALKEGSSSFPPAVRQDFMDSIALVRESDRPAVRGLYTQIMNLFNHGVSNASPNLALYVDALDLLYKYHAKVMLVMSVEARRAKEIEDFIYEQSKKDSAKNSGDVKKEGERTDDSLK